MSPSSACWRCAVPAPDAGYRLETRLPLRHTDSFGGTPFVHGSALPALTEVVDAIRAYEPLIEGEE